MKTGDTSEIQSQIINFNIQINALRKEISKIIVGQDAVLEKLLIALFSNGHVLLDGVPGLAKTLFIKTLSQCINAKFGRLQFTPDLLPSDLIGTMVFNPKEQDFSVKKGPIFSELLLADEINRAPAKVQSALLECMQEKQVTIGETSYKLSDLFLVLATQNPLDQGGTYPLPEAQLDRFMMKIIVTYLNKKDEMKLLDISGKQSTESLNHIFSFEEIMSIRALRDKIYVDQRIKRYIVDLVFQTREKNIDRHTIHKYIRCGASPRASICLLEASKMHAFLQGRSYVTPEDIKEIGFDVLRHRILLTYEAELDNITTEHIIKDLFHRVQVT